MSLRNGFFADNAVRINGKLEVTRNTTETCRYYAFYFGVADIGRDKNLFETLLDNFGIFRDDSKVYPNVYKSNAFIGNILRLEFTASHVYADGTLGQRREYYGYMAKETGTLWEYDSTQASCNHGFASYVANIIIRCLTGPDGIYGNNLILYNNENIIDCRLKIPTRDGSIEIAVKNGKRSVSVPRGYCIAEKQMV